MNLISIETYKELIYLELPTGASFVCRNEEEASRILKEIFEKKYYSDPRIHSGRVIRIVDLGAHIGLTTLFFSQVYPNATIESYEPNPFNFQLLFLNTDKIKHRTLISPKAVVVVDVNNNQLFMARGVKAGWTWGNSMIESHWNREQNTVPIEVPTIDIRDVLSKDIDILKIDVEGLEYDLIIGAGDLIQNVKYIFCEFHGIKKHDKNELKDLVNFLEQKGFEVEIICTDLEFDWKNEASIDQKLFLIKCFQNKYLK